MKTFVNPEVEIILLDQRDAITVSGELDLDLTLPETSLRG